MKILLLIAEHGWSFVIQAEALAKGLRELGVEHRLVRIVAGQVPRKVYADFQPDVVLGIGSWKEYQFFVEEPKQMGSRPVPWIVCDGGIDRHVDEFNKLGLLLTTSGHCREIFIRDGVKEDVITIIPEAVDHNFWHQLDQEDLIHFLELISVTHPTLELPFRFDLSALHRQQVPILFTTGGSATDKGAREVMEALAKLDKSIPWVYIIKTWPFPGSFQNSVQELKLAEKLGIYDRIRYISGEFSDEFIRGLMSACDVYVAPSRHEGFGLPLVQAQLCGKPVITVDATATRETIVPDETGLLAKRDSAFKETRADVEDLSKHLERLLTDTSLRETMGQKARDHAISRFSPAVVARKMLVTLQDVTAR